MKALHAAMSAIRNVPFLTLNTQWETKYYVQDIPTLIHRLLIDT